jgi:putative transposase
MIKAHKIRLHPTPEQANYFARAAGTARFVFNWALAEWKRQYEAGEKPNALALKKQFNAIRRDQFPWTYEVTKCAIEGAFMDVGKAFKNFFEGRKQGHRVGYPKFKRKKHSQTSFYLANDKFTVGDHWVDVPKLGRVNMAEKLRLAGKILGARVTKVASWWFISIQVELPDETPVNHHPAVGIDVGINRLATVSDARGFENQKPLRTSLAQLARAARALSRKKLGSRNREKARAKVARLYYRMSCIRDDILHKLTTEVARTCGVVGIEDLHVKGLLRNHCLALSLSDASLGRVLDLLESKVSAAGGTVVKVDRYFPSSKRCSQCHTVNPDLTLADRVFVCVNPNCTSSADRDYNASVNLLQEALRLIGAR